MFDKPRCRCSRCAANRRRWYVAVSGVCLVSGLGYFAVADNPETALDNALTAITEREQESISDKAPPARANSASASTQLVANINELPPSTGVTVDQRESPIAPASSPVKTNNGDLNAGELAVTSMGKSVATAYSSDPLGLLPSWLTGNRSKDPRSAPPALLSNDGNGAQETEKTNVEPGPDAQEPSKDSVLQAKNNSPETSEAVRQVDSELLGAIGTAPADLPEVRPTSAQH